VSDYFATRLGDQARQTKCVRGEGWKWHDGCGRCGQIRRAAVETQNFASFSRQKSII